MAMVARIQTRRPGAAIQGYRQLMAPAGGTSPGRRPRPQFGPCHDRLRRHLRGGAPRHGNAPRARLSGRGRTDAGRAPDGALLRGTRGEPPVDRTALVETIARVRQLAADCPDLVELDLNPLMATSTGVIAVDAQATFYVAIAGTPRPTPGSSARAKTMANRPTKPPDGDAGRPLPQTLADRLARRRVSRAVGSRTTAGRAAGRMVDLVLVDGGRCLVTGDKRRQ